MKTNSFLKRLMRVMSLLLISTFFACEGGNRAAVAIDTQLELHPPIADQIFLKLDPQRPDRPFIMARFPEEELQKVDSKTSFSMRDGNDSILAFGDDGKFGDEVAGDRIFTARMHSFSLSDFVSEAREINEMIQHLKSGRSTFFTGRERIPVDTSALIPFDPRIFRPDFKADVARIPLPAFTDLLCAIGSVDPRLETHSLMITDLGVVEDPDRTINPCEPSSIPGNITERPWSFGFLMHELANTSLTGVDVSDFAKNWLQSWQFPSPQIINGDEVPSRTFINQFIADWEAVSAANNGPSWPPGKLDMRFAPFKLMAIVNRLDLRGNSGYGFSNAGEGRFVFAALTPQCQTLRFTVIFEYGINKHSCSAVKSFTQAWYQLKDLSVGSATYNAALEGITDQFTLAGTNPAKPNHSSLNQIRSNEFVSSSPEWELREWIMGSGHMLEPTTVKQEPHASYNHEAPAAMMNPADVQILENYINNNTPAILAQNHTVPMTEAGQDFLGGHSPAFSPSYFWDGRSIGGTFQIVNANARHLFSLNTCSGCHAGETATFFTHISPPGSFGVEAPLSGFLTGISVSDPANRPDGAVALRNFDDLGRRAIDLECLIRRPCHSIIDLLHRLSFKPLVFTH